MNPSGNQHYPKVCLALLQDRDLHDIQETLTQQGIPEDQHIGIINSCYSSLQEAYLKL